MWQKVKVKNEWVLVQQSREMIKWKLSMLFSDDNDNDDDNVDGDDDDDVVLG